MYDVEQSKKESAEIKAAFAKMFPLCDERDLPWAICHIEEFLKKRIAHEINQGAFRRESGIVEVLCEVSPPKNHVVDMARIVVEQAKEAAGFAKQVQELSPLLKEREQLLNLTRMLDRHPDGYDGPCFCKACQEFTAMPFRSK